MINTNIQISKRFYNLFLKEGNELIAEANKIRFLENEYDNDEMPEVREAAQENEKRDSDDSAEDDSGYVLSGPRGGGNQLGDQSMLKDRSIISK